MLKDIIKYLALAQEEEEKEDGQNLCLWPIVLNLCC
jgi:hypothetical protein